MKRFLLHIGIFVFCMVVLVAMFMFLTPSNPTDYTREFFVKKEMLADTGRASSIVLLGGSNVALGYNSPMLSERMNMPVINVGLNAGVGIKLMIDESFPYLRKGDILVFSPEYDQFFDLFAYGYMPLSEIFYQGQGAYASKMNLLQWRSVCMNTPMSLQKRFDYQIERLFIPSEQDNLYQLSSFNEYGDVVAHWHEKHKLLPIKVEKAPVKSPKRRISLWVGERLQEIVERGVQVYMVPPVLAKTEYANREDNIRAVESILKDIGFPFVCAPVQMTYPDSLFYDTYYHLDSLGAAIHTEDVINLLKKINSVEE